jgi:hypothetical protein
MKKSRYIELPDTWDELTEADWRELLKIRQHIVAHGGRYSYLDVTTETARIMLKNRGISCQPGNQQYVLLVGQLAKSLGWLWHADDNTLSLVYKDTRNLLPHIREWTGPASHGADLMFGEFRTAVALIKDYERTPNETILQALAGLLYRPAATPEQQHGTGLRRQPWNWDPMEKNFERGRQMKPWQTWGVYAWFAWFCEYLTTGTFIIEGEEMCFAPLFSKSSGSSRKGPGGMTAIALTLAESHVFGTVKEVEDTPLLTVMQKLLADYYMLEKLKKERI